MRGKTARLGGGSAPVHPQSAQPDRPSAATAQDGTIQRRTHGSEKRRRSMLLAIRLTPEELALIDSQAERAALRTGSYARMVLLGVRTRQVRRPPIERRELVRLLGELGHVGSNLNQLAHTGNAGFPVTRSDIRRALDELQPVRDAILIALGRQP